MTFYLRPPIALTPTPARVAPNLTTQMPPSGSAVTQTYSPADMAIIRDPNPVPVVFPAAPTNPDWYITPKPSPVTVTSQTTVWSSPDFAMEALRQSLQSARRSLDLNMYQVTSTVLCDELIAMHQVSPAGGLVAWACCCLDVFFVPTAALIGSLLALNCTFGRLIHALSPTLPSGDRKSDVGVAVDSSDWVGDSLQF